MIARFMTGLKNIRDTQQRIGELRTMMLAATADGLITDAELAEIEIARQELGLSDQDFGRLKSEVFAAALRAAKGDQRITPEEEQGLAKLAEYLGVPSHQLARNEAELSRYRLLYEIDQGNLPITIAAGLVPRKDEITYWAEPGCIVEEKTVKRYRVSSGSSYSIPIVKGVRYRVGSSRSQTITETDLVPVSEGDFIITNQRLVFLGDAKSFDAKWDKVLGLQLHSDGVQVTISNKSKSQTVQFDSQNNVEIVASVLSYAMNNA